MPILITGGAGYIGSHVAKQLLEQGRDIVILDNLSTGRIETLETLRDIKDFHFVQLDLCQFDKVRKLLQQYSFETIVHFAGSIVVPESVVDPLKYYMNNTVNTTNLIRCGNESQVKKFIFSSTAAVYGEPMGESVQGVDEDSITIPINPYGQSKLMSEIILNDCGKLEQGFKYVILRYFNVAGADINYKENNLVPRIGQSFPDATHLIKIASECAVGKRKEMAMFGNDYPTADGTCIRDYIHVDDLASAHLSAIEYLDEHESDTFNCGYGRGYSVKEVIDAMKEITGVDFSVVTKKRRTGDAAQLVSKNAKIKSKTNWVPQYDDLSLICKSAYEWEKSSLRASQ